MIGAGELDLMVRGGTLALLALWSWLLVRDHRALLPARVAVAMNLAIACHVIATIRYGDAGGPVGLLLELGAGSVPVAFWLLARTWFSDRIRIGRLGWLLVALSLLLVLAMHMSYRPVDPPLLHELLAVAFRVSMVVFALAGLWEVWRGREDDLVEVRRTLRGRMIGAVGAFVLLTNAIEIAVFQGIAPDSLRSLLQGGILLLTFAFCALMFGTRLTDLFGVPPQTDRQATAPSPSAQHDPLAMRLAAHMAQHLPWRDEGLTIAALAAQLGEQEYRLRRTINGTLGHRNFAAFLNSYRLAEVKAALADPAQRDVPILTIALDAGFGSLGPFNRAFRETEAMTPSEWRVRALAQAG